MVESNTAPKDVSPPETASAPKAPPSKKHPGGVIAELLQREGMLSDEQLQYARRVQSKMAVAKPLVHILMGLGYTTNDQLQQALRKNRIQLRIGDLLVELGHLRESDLSAALSMQRDQEEGKKLGDILVEKHFIEEEKLCQILSYQLGMPVLQPSLAEIDRKLIAKVSPKWLKEQDFLPIREDGKEVIVVFADPLDRKERETALQVFGPRIKPAISTRKAIRETIDLLQRGSLRSAEAAYDESTVIGIINTLVEAALREGISDIHVEPMRDRLRIRFRRDGVLVHYKDLNRDLCSPISTRLKVLAKADIAEKRRHQDGRFLYESPITGEPLDLRASFYVTIHGEKIVLRLLRQKETLLSLDDLGMPPKTMERYQERTLDFPSGILIITGPTGSGKTTTLYGSVNYLNDPETSIVTAEDPVEYQVDGISQCSINPKIGLTFEETLRHIVRQDPDIIVLGEVRDAFSAETAIQAALTGHKVLTTFHTEDSIGALLRLMNMDIQPFLIASTIIGVLAQRLLRKVCPQCSEPYQPTMSELRRIGYRQEDLAGCNFRIGKGCSACAFTGNRGRIGAFELLILNEPVRDAVLQRKPSSEIRRLSIETSGLVSLFEDGLVKAAEGQVSLQDVLRLLPRINEPRPLNEIKRLLGM
ncbi:type II/IV secretion system protein [uncultured Desulfuromonas sp.]|uniref:GspE/PulE family protein n=1 Tax=uncultured Desulfuromonas sp. TaxID=181013 RepID=UPI00261A89F9|nr:type II/IV secretion system protein [uncultured Desulfuromonas sp.]